MVGEVAAEGNINVKFSVIKSQVKAKKGRLYDRAELDHDIQALLGLGHFEKAAADVTELADSPVPEKFRGLASSSNTVKVTFIVTEKPVVKKIHFEGTKKISKGKLSETIALKEKDPMDAHKAREDAAKILALYQERGFLEAVVDHSVQEIPEKRQVELFFKIQEGPKVTVAAVDLAGVAAFKPKKVLKLMKNRRKKVFNPKALEPDQKAVEAYYKNRGYLDFQILASTPVFSEDRSKVSLRFEVSEGKVYRFGQTSFSGNTVYSDEELLKTLEYKRGKTFSQEKFDETIRNIQERLADKGRLKATVRPVKSYNEATGEMDVRFEITEGNIIYVDHIDVEGNKSTKTHVLRREIVIKEGEPFSAAKIRKSQEKLFNLQFLNDVMVDIQSPTDPDLVDLTFEVVEGQPGMLTAGAGFSSLDGLVGTVSVQHLNLFGRAQRTSVQWSFGARVQDYSVSWTTPWILDRPTSLGLDVYNTRRLHPFQTSTSGFLNRRTGGAVRLGPRFQDDKYQLHFSYSLQKVSIADVRTEFTSLLTEGTSIQSSLGADAAIDTRDSFWDPTRGCRHSAGFQVSGGPLQGDIHYFKPSLSNGCNWRLFSVGSYPFVMSIGNRAGYVTPFGQSKEVPVFDRFFLGGQDTLRGYAPSGEVGPPAGAKVYDVLNVEFKFPLARERKRTIVQFVTFFDIGGAWENTRSVRLQTGTGERDIKADAGFGIRFTTPAFPIRLEWGYGFNHRPGESVYQINFGIGNLF